MSGLDYMSFAQGEMIGELAARRNVNAWAQHSQTLEAQLNEACQERNAYIIMRDGAVSLIQEMMAEIEKSNPGSPLSDFDYVAARLREISNQNAISQGYQLDYDNRVAYK